MADDVPGTEGLNLAAEFPPVATEQWEAVIRADLKGADYDKKLVWATPEGIPVRPYYRAGDAPGRAGTAASRTWRIEHDCHPSPGAVRADDLHERGANAVQELGYGIAAGVERLAKLTETDPVETAAGRVEFVFAVGPAYFIEIAKFRAARLLWSQVMAAYGSKKDTAPMRISVRTPRRNKSTCDRYNNLLRVTTEAMAAVIGGCDGLTVEPFGFDSHLALNVQRILLEESHLDAVADPAGGSYYVEALTAALAREAWKVVQQVEAEGGYEKAVASGSVEKAIAQSRAALEKAMSSRRRVLVGVNNYPNTQEQGPAAEAPADDEYRLALPFERIRARTERHAKETGRRPKILLLKRGDLKTRMARANFCLNFFGCGGFEMVEAEDYAGTDASLIVLCSSDAEYAALVADVAPRVNVPVLVAGYPKDQVDALKAAGAQGFVHIGSDAVQTLTEWQDRFGMRK